MKTVTQEPLNIYISHRHEDKRIADVFRKAFDDWDATIKVFQSSNAEHAVRIGEGLDASIKTAIAKSNVILLIYTTEHTDWSWCMYECGLAQDPVTNDTRLVVFHSTADPPPPLQHLVTVPLSKEAIRTLVDNFHRDPEFVPRYTGATVPGLDEAQIEKRALELYKDLTKVIPNISAKKVRRYDRLTLGLDLGLVMELKELEREVSYREASVRAKDVIKESALVRRVVGEPHAHFNFEAIEQGMKFADLVDRWEKETEYSDLEWQDDLYDEMVRAVLNRKERALSSVFNSLEPDTNRWILPVVSRFRIVPSEECAELDVLLCSIKSDTARKMTEKA